MSCRKSAVTSWQAALAAAQAGVDDYLAKLNRTDAYALTVDCSNDALKAPKPRRTPVDGTAVLSRAG